MSDVNSAADAVARGGGFSTIARRVPAGPDASGIKLEWAEGKPCIPQLENRVVYAAVKRCLDVALGLLAVVFLAPLLVIIAVMISATSKGPPLFVQPRVGRGGRSFNLVKFRTLHIEDADPSGIRQTTCNDERITWLGRYLRRTSFDELPQLWNVIRGDMSIVGPRPHVENMLAGGTSYRTLVPYYDDRLVVRPGLTGWAQANGFRGPTDNPDMARARIDHDIAYIQQMSLWLDLTIILRTIRRELGGGTGS